MGTLRDKSTGGVRLLESYYIIGRLPPPQCALTLDPLYISGVHAEVRWTGERWELRDLGSRNGTYVDGARMNPGFAQKVVKGTRIGFGKREQEWEMTDDGAPVVMAVPLQGGNPVMLDGDGMLALPSKDEPEATIYKTVDGSWTLERPDEMPIRLTDRQPFEAVGRVWRFSCPETNATTIVVDGETPNASMYVRDLTLVFSVTPCLEYVHLRVKCNGAEYDMGARQHHFFLLTLAQRWLEEAAKGEPEPSCGWLDQEEVAHDPSMAPPRLTLSVHRIRGQFQRIGVVDFGSIIQRRLRQVRIGCGNIQILKV